MARKNEGMTKKELEDLVRRQQQNKPPIVATHIGKAPPEPQFGSVEWANRILAQWLFDQKLPPNDRIYNVNEYELRLASSILAPRSPLGNLFDVLLNPAYTGSSGLDAALDYLGNIPVESKPLPPPVNHSHSR